MFGKLMPDFPDLPSDKKNRGFRVFCADDQLTRIAIIHWALDRPNALSIPVLKDGPLASPWPRPRREADYEWHFKTTRLGQRDQPGGHIWPVTLPSTSMELEHSPERKTVFLY